MKHFFPCLLFTSSFLLLTSCSSATPTTNPEAVTVQYTAASAPWLADLYTCSGDNVVKTELRAADFLDPQSADLVMRIGQPSNLTSPAYQIGTDDLLVIVNRQNPINKLTSDQVRGLFTGQVSTWKDINGTDAPVQVWVFSTGEDVQQLFDQAVLGGSPVASTARLAAGPEEMAQAIANDINSIGILTRRWKMGNVADVFVAASAPVMAITPPIPKGVISVILACLQK